MNHLDTQDVGDLNWTRLARYDPPPFDIWRNVCPQVYVPAWMMLFPTIHVLDVFLRERPTADPHKVKDSWNRQVHRLGPTRETALFG